MIVKIHTHTHAARERSERGGSSSGKGLAPQNPGRLRNPASGGEGRRGRGPTVGMSESRGGVAPVPSSPQTPPHPRRSPVTEKGWKSCLQENQGYWGREGGGPGP